MELSIILPAYKEAENLKKILPSINSVLQSQNVKYEIIVVDTIEKMDDTFDVCKLNNVVCIFRQGGNYYGDAIRTGIHNSKGKYILIMDADGSHEVKSIVELYKKISDDDYDIVVGSRYCKGGKTDNNFILKAMSWMLNVTYRVIFGLKVKDCSNSFRIYDSNKLKSIELECINFDIVEEILIKLQLKFPLLKMGEVPVHFKKREEGFSKRDLVKFILTYFSTIKRLLYLKNNVKK